MVTGFKSCQSLFPKATKIVVLGDMLELGNGAAEAHRKVGVECFNLLTPDLLITIGPQSREIAAGAISAGLTKDKVLSFEHVEQAIALPMRVFTKREVIYLKGSNAMNLKLLVAHLLEPRI
jgi:UDP-N-acetylmuramoyl-tripeptide--D-alanyl-D-alanine ligase